MQPIACRIISKAPGQRVAFGSTPRKSLQSQKEEIAEPFFPPAMPSVTRVGIMQRYWQRFLANFRKADDPIAQEAKLRHLLDEMQSVLRQGKATVQRHQADTKWYQDCRAHPYGPSQITIGGRPYSVRMKHKKVSNFDEKYRETWVLKSEDGRFHITFRHVKEYRYSTPPPSKERFTYRDNFKGVKLTSHSKEVADRARIFFSALASRFRTYYEERMKNPAIVEDRLDF